MALPIQPTNTQAGCNPVSSNCVIWQGPDIPCITLCKGDSISDVTYKVATELCTLVDQLDITGFDVSCFPPICPKPENIHDLIQFIIDTLCTTVSSTSGTTKGLLPGEVSVTNCEDAMNCLVTVAPCFQETNSFGDLITQMSIKDYAAEIGAKVCQIVDQLVVINATLVSLDNRISVFEDCDACNPVIPPIEIPTSCLTAGTDIPIEDFVQTLETAFCELKTATGSAAELYAATTQQCVNLDTSPSLSNTSVNMGSLPGWVTAGNYNTLADAVNNMWITICDIRSAVFNVVTTCCAPSCDNVDLFITATYSAPNILLTIGGTVSGTFADCYAAGSFLTITDAFGNAYTTQLPVIANVGGAAVTVPIGTSSLNPFTDYTVTLNVCVDDSTNSLKCNQVLTTSVTNSASCPAIVYAKGAPYNFIDYTITNLISSPVTYIVECWNSTLTAIVTSTTHVNPPLGSVIGTLSGLTAGATYEVRVRVITGSTINDCPYTEVQTKP
jgi:hypothetical protein